MQQAAIWILSVIVTFIFYMHVGAEFNPENLSESQKQAALQWFLRKVSKRGSVLNKCEKHSACALLQSNPASSSYWIDEICYCGEGAKCSLEWGDGEDGKSVNNGDTQLKLCHPVTTLSKCNREQTAVTTAMETSVQNPTIKQSASVFCNCPRVNHEYKLIDAGMVDEGDRTVVTAHFGCASVEHCRASQPCKFLAILPTGDSLVHQSCECPQGTKCPKDTSPDGVTPATLDGITYYPFTCRSDEIQSLII